MKRREQHQRISVISKKKNNRKFPTFFPDSVTVISFLSLDSVHKIDINTVVTRNDMHEIICYL